MLEVVHVSWGCSVHDIRKTPNTSYCNTNYDNSNKISVVRRLMSMLRKYQWRLIF